MRTLAGFIGLAVVFAAVGAAQATMSATTIDRGVEASITGNSDSDSNSATGVYDEFVGVADGAAEAIQFSDIDLVGLHVEGFGDAFMDGFGNDPFARSYFDFAFALTEDYAYQLTVDLDSGAEAGLPVALFYFFGDTAGVIADLQDVGGNFNGILPAGNYLLQASAIAQPEPQSDSGLGGATFDFDLQLSPLSTAVPEPITATLTLIAAAALAMTTRRRRA